MSQNEYLHRAEQRQLHALAILDELDLVRRWSRISGPEIVGAVSMNLVAALDIDLEIYAANPTIEQGFAVMAEVAQLPHVWQVSFSNELKRADQGLYWGIRYRDEDGNIWNVDCWFVRDDHPDAHWCATFASQMAAVLTDANRTTMIELKEAALREGGARAMDVYRAVLEGGVQSLPEFREWLKTNRTAGMSRWLPAADRANAPLNS